MAALMTGLKSEVRGTNISPQMFLAAAGLHQIRLLVAFLVL